MGDEKVSGYYKQAWHGELPYSELEMIRLERACEFVRQDAGERQGAGRGRQPPVNGGSEPGT